MSLMTLDVLQFWKNLTGFTILKNMAMRVLAIAASQATDERVFSSAGVTLSSGRPELSKNSLSLLTFVHRNM